MYTFPDLQPVHCSMSVFKCCFLTCIQISQEAGKVVWYFLPFKNFLQFILIHTVNGFGVADKGKIDIFFFFCVQFSFLFSMMQWKLISGSSVFSKFSLNFWKFSVHVLLEPRLGEFWALLCQCVKWLQFCGFEHFCHCFIWNGNENSPCPVLWLMLGFPNLLAYWVQHFHSIIFLDLK